MKTNLLLILLGMIACLNALQAQELYVRENSGTQTEYCLSEIRKLTFPAGIITVHENNGNTETYSVSGLRYLNFEDLAGPGPGPGPVTSVPAMSAGKILLLSFLFMLLGVAYLAIRKKRPAGRLLSFFLLIGLSTGVFGQNDTMYIMKSGAIVGQYIVNTEVDSVIFYKPTATDVYNPATGKTWMDRNLGASRAATSSTDAEAYGDLYQWGRGTDGHEKRISGTTSTLSTSDTPGHGNFILAPNSPYDWRSPQNPNLWQGVSGANNPCPSGYRLPTEAEWEAERQSWGSNNKAGAFASPLKLPVAGGRSYTNGSLFNVGSDGGYWSSTVDGIYSRALVFGSSNAYVSSQLRAYGLSVRCLKD